MSENQKGNSHEPNSSAKKTENQNTQPLPMANQKSEVKGSSDQKAENQTNQNSTMGNQKPDAAKSGNSGNSSNPTKK